MKTIKIVLTPEAQKKVVRVIGIILFIVVMISVCYKVVSYTKMRINLRYNNCSNILYNQSISLNETMFLFEDCNQTLINISRDFGIMEWMFTDCNSSLERYKSDSNLLHNCEIDLEKCYDDRDSYKKKYINCDEDLDDCEGGA